MAGKKIKFQMSGPPSENGHLLIDDLIKELSYIKRALAETDRIVSRGRSSSTYLRVSDLSHSSPAAVVLEAMSRDRQNDFSDTTVNTFCSSIEIIQVQKRKPAMFDTVALQAYRDIAIMVTKRRIFDVVVSQANLIIPLLPTFSSDVEAIIGPDEWESGESRQLEQMNIHNRQNVFTIYPTGRGVRIQCVFPDRLKEEAIRAMDRYVTVRGTLRYKSHDAHPHTINVRDIEVHPQVSDLPTFTDLRGIAPNATGSLSSEDFVREIRDGW